MHLLEEQDALRQRRLEVLRSDIQEGISAIDQGGYREYADWRELADEIESEGRRQSMQQVSTAG